MPDVHLPNDQPPVFPDECMVCGRERPGDGVVFKARFNGMQPLRQTHEGPFRATVPTCAGCRGALVRSRWLGKGAVGIGLVVSVALILGNIRWGWIAAEGWVSYLVLFAMLVVPFAVAQWAYTARFDFSPWSNRVVYSFRDKGYAARFAEINDGEVR